MVDSEHPRRRVRHVSPAGQRSDPSTCGRAALTTGAHDPEQEQPDPRRSEGPADEDREADRGLRGLVGSRTSQVSVTAALRARDAARPTDDDLAEAEQRLVIVRRNWVPRDDPPRGR